MQVRDPVCGMQFPSEQGAATREYRGATYHFCSARCATAFDKEPERFTGGKE